MTSQHKMQSWTTARDLKIGISCRSTSFYLVSLGKYQIQSKILIKGLDQFCFPELKLHLSHYFEVLSEIKMELIFSFYHTPNYDLRVLV